MFELWEIVNGAPFFLIKKHQDYNTIYNLFKKNIENKQCVIVRTESFENTKNTFIYESPDNGKTVYKRLFGDYKNKVLVVKEEIN